MTKILNTDLRYLLEILVLWGWFDSMLGVFGEFGESDFSSGFYDLSV